MRHEDTLRDTQGKLVGKKAQRTGKNKEKEKCMTVLEKI